MSAASYHCHCELRQNTEGAGTDSSAGTGDSTAPVAGTVLVF
jgi:hypothetical protein